MLWRQLWSFVVIASGLPVSRSAFDMTPEKNLYNDKLLAVLVCPVAAFIFVYASQSVIWSDFFHLLLPVVMK